MLFVVLLLIIVGYALGRYGRRRWRCCLYALALLALVAAGNGLLPALLLKYLQTPYEARTPITWQTRNAIVLLGAGTVRLSAAVEPTLFAQGRIAETARLYRACRQTGNDCKILLSGGDPLHNDLSEAEATVAPLRQLGVEQTDLILETRSLSTWQNAQFSQPLLNAYGPQQTVLVSSALHLQRAQLYFAHFGIHAVPVRGDYMEARPSWLPSAWNMALTDIALHEYIGMLTFHAYNVLGWNAAPPSLAH